MEATMPAAGTDRIVVEAPRVTVENGRPRATASILMGNRPFEIWYEASSGPLSDGMNALLTAALIPAMKQGGSLHLPGPVSPQLLEEIPTIQDILHLWYPALQQISLEAAPLSPQTSQANPPPAGVGLFFSGGVDSFYSLLKRNEEITSLIFVHGFDIRLDDDSLYAQTAQTIQRIAAQFKKSLVLVRTNLRSFSDLYTDWGQHYHGAALASVAHVLAPQFKKIYIASTNPYQVLVPWGSHPLLDPRWSTETLQIVLDGCEASRIQKTLRIASHPVVQKSLRACWENRNGASNCGLCEKCLRTMANLRAAGTLDRFQTFARPLDLGRLRRVPIRSERLRECVNATYQHLQDAGKDPELAAALRDCLDGLYEKGMRGWPRRALQKTQRWMLN